MRLCFVWQLFQKLLRHSNVCKQRSAFPRVELLKPEKGKIKGYAFNDPFLLDAALHFSPLLLPEIKCDFIVKLWIFTPTQRSSCRLHWLHSGSAQSLCRLIPSTLTASLYCRFLSSGRVCFILHTVRVYKVEAGRSCGPVTLRRAALTRTDQRKA